MSAAEQLSALLENNIMDLADLPEFPTLPTGSYLMQFRSLAPKMFGEIPGIEAEFTYHEPIEVPGGEEVTMESGKELKFGFALTTKAGEANAMGQGNLKVLLTPFAESFGCVTMADVNEKGANAMCAVTVKTTASKTDASKKFMNAQALAIQA